MDHDYSEVLFLKDGLQQGDKWVHYHGDSTWYTVFTVRTFESRKMVKGQRFTNVIGITANTLNAKDEESGNEFMNNVPLPTYYYAENIGLIYTYMPYPLSETYADREIVLDKGE